MNNKKILNKNILLVEDECIIAYNEKNMLEKYDYNVIIVNSGEKAIETVQQNNHIDLILMDIDLGQGMDGTETAQIILKTKDIPIVFLSSHIKPEIVEKTEKITSYGYIVKNSSITVIDASIKMAFKLFQEKLKNKFNEEQAKISNKRYHELFKNISSCVAIFKAVDGGNDFVIVDLNNASAKTEKIERNEVIGKKVTEVFPGAMDFGILSVFKRVWKTGTSEFLPLSYYKDSRISGWRENYVYKLPSEEIVSIYNDKTIQYQMEKSLKESYNVIKKILDTVDALIYIIDMTSYEILFINEYGKKKFGDVIGKTCWKYLQDSQNGPCSFCTNSKLLDKNGIPTGVYHWIFQNTINNKWYDCRDTVIKWQDGRYVRMEIATDITNLKEAEIKLSKINNAYDKVFNSTTSIMFLIKVFDADTFRFVHTNYSHQKATGISLQEIINKTPVELVGEELGNVLNCNYKRCYNAMQPITYEETENLNNSKTIWETTLSPVIENNKVHYIIGSSIDITERKNAENALIETKDFLNNIINSLGNPVFVKDYKHRWILLNHAFCEFMGFSHDELIGKSDFDFFPKEEAEVFWSKDNEVFNTCKENLNEEKFTDSKGVEHTILTKKILYKDNLDNKYIVGIITDITDIKIAEQKIKSLLSQKEILLNETHHRIKNNMNVIRSILSMEANNQENGTKCNNILNDCANRLMTMMTLYDYLYNNEIKQKIDIGYFIKNLIDQFLEIYKHKFFRTQVNIQEIYITPKIASNIGIIINELFTNSVKYAFEEIDNPLISLYITKTSDIIKIVFSDNGKGLPNTISFEDAETFGLKLINMLVKEIDGKIEVDRQKGTKFIIEFQYI